MPTNFSTITPLNPANISRPPSFTTTNTPASQPAASSPMDGEPPAKKKSHKFIKTVGTLVIIAAALGLARKYLPNTFNPELKLAADAGIVDKGLYYAKKYIGMAGDYINSWTGSAINGAKGLYEKAANYIKNPGNTTTPPTNPAP